VIRASFTPGFCSPSPRERDVVACVQQQVVLKDGQINYWARKVFDRIGGEAKRRRFVAAERAWLAYRTTSCRSAADKFEGGSAAPLMAADCMRRLDDDHIDELLALDKLWRMGQVARPAR
jgi:uncharacterized protein YecT (DUF1311 family)